MDFYPEGDQYQDQYTYDNQSPYDENNGYQNAYGDQNFDENGQYYDPNYDGQNFQQQYDPNQYNYQNHDNQDPWNQQNQGQNYSEQQQQTPRQNFGDLPEDIEDNESTKKDEGADRKLKAVMRTMNKLYDTFHQLKLQDDNLSLPRIVVCGSQSAGKTSVLENITGEQFLPRGADIQTRCPIVLQLVKSENGKKWVEFLHKPGQKYFDMGQVRNEIESKNLEIDDAGMVVSPIPITLKLYSPDVANLTLVDLPGLVETPVAGQPANLVEKINDLVYEYINDENSIILAISAATNDIANSKSISMALDIDKGGKRTLGVLTKLDLVEQGHEFQTAEVLKGRKIQIALGIIGVVNRSLMQIRTGMSLPDCIKHEKRVFNEKFPDLASKNGTPYLINRVSDLLMNSILETLPKTKKVIQKLIEECKKEREALGDVEKQNVEQSKFLTRQVNKFVDKYRAQIDGQHRNVGMDSLSTHAMIRMIFDDKLKKKMDSIDASNIATDEQIDNLISNSMALHSRQDSPDDAFQELAKSVISRLEPLTLECADAVAKIMRNAIRKCLDQPATEEHEKIIEFIEETAKALIDYRFMKCEEYLKYFLAAEASFAATIKGKFRHNADLEDIAEDLYNNNGPISKGRTEKADYYDYCEDEDEYEDLSDSTRNEGEGEGSDSENSQDGDKQFVGKFRYSNAIQKRHQIRVDVSNYFQIAKDSIREHVAKGITYQLVYAVSEELSEHMNGESISNDRPKTILKSTVNPIERKKELTALIKSYKKAKNLIDKVLEDAEI